MNSNCRCGLSVIKKQCSRDTWDCKRCLHRMKNTGNVWTIDTLGAGLRNFTEPDLITGPILNFPAFVHTMFWDAVPANQTPVPTGAQCLSGLHGLSLAGREPRWGFNTANEGDTRLISTLYYYENKWWLSFSLTLATGFDTTNLAELVYSTDEDRCLIPVSSPGVFTLDSFTQDPETLYESFPEKINFYHTKVYD